MTFVELESELFFTVRFQFIKQPNSWQVYGVRIPKIDTSDILLINIKLNISEVESFWIHFDNGFSDFLLVISNWKKGKDVRPLLHEPLIVGMFFKSPSLQIVELFVPAAILVNMREL